MQKFDGRNWVRFGPTNAEEYDQEVAMSRMFNPRVFQLGYVGLGCTDLERSAQYYTETLGLTETTRGHGSEIYASVGYEHHNVVLTKAAHKSLLQLGYQLKPEIDLADFAKQLGAYGARGEVKSDS